MKTDKIKDSLITIATTISIILPTVMLILMAYFGLVLYCGWAWNNIEPTEIPPGENGKCSDRLKDYMRDQFGIYIPDCAEYVGGSFNNAFRDPAMRVAFDVKLSEWDEYEDGMSDDDILLLLSNGADLYGGDGSSNAIEMSSDMFGREYRHSRGFTGKPTMGFSYVAFSDTNVSKADGVISFAFTLTGYCAPRSLSRSDTH